MMATRWNGVQSVGDHDPPARKSDKGLEKISYAKIFRVDEVRGWGRDGTFV